MINACRICNSALLEEVLTLGNMAFTGIFPNPGETVPHGPLTLLLCTDCGLVQLADNFDPKILYGPTYGYHSGLNKSMVSHLHSKAQYLESQVVLTDSDIILDIGSNDGTLLGGYASLAMKIGVDPNASKWLQHYGEFIRSINDFFPSSSVSNYLDGRKSKLITSIAMFYDLQDPVGFAQAIKDCLHEDGIWHTEQAYLPTMLSNRAFDSICHEHIEYYSLANINDICQRVGLRIIDVMFNEVNGGSFGVTMAHKDSRRPTNPTVERRLAVEHSYRLREPQTYHLFKDGIDRAMQVLRDKIASIDGPVLGYGASTKGNVLLQYANISLPAIADVNEEKFGKVTPGTNIPIVDEATAKGMAPGAFLVLPWHFFDNIVEREQEYLNNGGKMIFPLPNPRIIEKKL